MDQQVLNGSTQDGGSIQKNIDEKYCESCGEIIKIKAEICPKCGVRQKRNISKAALLLFTFFLGGIGAHKFYTGKNWQGVFYLIFFWTWIPGLIALIEFIIYACTSSDKLQEKYEASGTGVVIAVVASFFAVIFIGGILAAIAIPQFVTYRNRAYQAAVKDELQKILTVEDAYFAENGKYSIDIIELGFKPKTPDVKIEIINADENCFQAIGSHIKLHEPISVNCNGFE